MIHLIPFTLLFTGCKHDLAGGTVCELDGNAGDGRLLLHGLLESTVGTTSGHMLAVREEELAVRALVNGVTSSTSQVLRVRGFLQAKLAEAPIADVAAKRRGTGESSSHLALLAMVADVHARLEIGNRLTLSPPSDEVIGKPDLAARACEDLEAPYLYILVDDVLVAGVFAE